MSDSQVEIAPDPDQKVAIEMDERSNPGPPAGVSHIPVTVSAFADLSFFQTVARFPRAIGICTAVFMGALFDGYAVTAPGNIAGMTSFIEQFGTVEVNGIKALDATYVGVWGGMISVGQIIGMISGGFSSDRLGRKFNIYGIAVLILMSIIHEYTAKNWLYFTFARLLCGWGTGLVQTTLTSYVAEIAPSNIRGAMLSIYSVWFAVGQFAANVGLQIVQSKDLGWRSAIVSQFVFLGLFIPAVALAPESPWYHALRGEDSKAINSLRWINGGVKGYNIEAEYSIIKQEVDRALNLRHQSAALGWTACFKGTNLRRTFISWFPLQTQQFLGIPLVFGYLAYFFSLSGVANPFIPTVITSCILIPCIVGSSFTIELVGRRRMLLFGEVICFLCVLCMGIIGTVFSGQLTEGASAGLIVLASIWVATYGFSGGPIGWAYVADTATPVIRAKTTGFAAEYTFALGRRFIDNRCGEDVNAWINEIKAQYRELKSLNFDLDSLCVNVLLTGLPERFQAFVDTLWTATDSPTIDSVCDSILRIHAGQQSRDSGSDTLGNVLTARMKRVHLGNRSRPTPSAANPCRVCNSSMHWANDCPHREEESQPAPAAATLAVLAQDDYDSDASTF